MSGSKKDYEERLAGFEGKFLKVKNKKPREDYLYPVMDGVPFRDLVVDLDMILSKENEEEQETD